MTLEQALEEIETLKEANAQLRDMLGFRWTPHERLPLGKAERVILGLLVKTGQARNEQIAELVWGDRPDGGPDDINNNVKVHLSKLRRKLVPLGVTIKTLWNIGYVMSKEDRAKLTGDLDAAFDAVREHKHIPLEHTAVVERRVKPEVPMSDRPKGKWAW